MTEIIFDFFSNDPCIIQKDDSSLHRIWRKRTFVSTKRAFSSVGSEHLPYKQRVGGSNPSTPTKASITEAFFYARL